MHVCFTLFQYRGWKEQWWGFVQMGWSPGWLAHLEGCHFAKMLGSGAGTGFSMWPDFSTYALLTCWRREEDYRHFEVSNPRYQSMCQRAYSHRTLYLQPIQSHGSWSGQQPFDNAARVDLSPTEPVAVLTRATIHPKKLIRFWKFVPVASRALAQADPPPLFAKGIGELPLVQQATFSIWHSQEDLTQFAYRQNAHADIVKRTRREHWYKEDLFARFRILSDKTFS